MALDHHLLRLLPIGGYIDYTRAYTCTIIHVYKHTHPHGSTVMREREEEVEKRGSSPEPLGVLVILSCPHVCSYK